MDEMALEYEGKILFYKVDTQVEQDLAGMFGIRSIPSILFVPAKGKPQMATGALPKAAIERAIAEVLKVG